MKYFILFLMIIAFVSCKTDQKEVKNSDKTVIETVAFNKSFFDTTSSELLKKYTPFTLETDMSKLDENEREIIDKLIDAAKIMDDMFWYEAYGDKESLLNSINNEDKKLFANINYGPWDRLNNNMPFIDGTESKAAGSNFYPKDMTKDEFVKADLKDKESLYTFIRRDKDGRLKAVPYHVHFKEGNEKAASLLRDAANVTQTESLKKYLNLRADALLNDDYQKSDMAWLDMKDNHIDIVIGPIETYEDQLFGYKAAHEAYVLVKDMEWSKRLEKYAQFLPDLQKGLPVSEEYKSEKPGRDTELNAYDVIYYSGDCNAGSKTIAINLPNDEEVQLKKGTRRLQLKNAMKAKFEKILLPISKELIDPSQRKHVTFDAFFSNTMFHEVAHGLGIKNTINGKGTVRKALKEHASALEEGKADMLGLYMVKQLFDQGELDGDIMDYYVTFMTSIFRSVRFGASSAHGKANMIRFNYFDEKGAFNRDDQTGLYKINPTKLLEAMNSLSEEILILQGNGDYEGVASLVNEKGVIKEQLKQDLDKLSKAGIAVDVVFNQGKMHLK